MRKGTRAGPCALIVLALAGCGVNYHVRPPSGGGSAATWPPAQPGPKTAASSLPGPLIAADGTCSGPAPAGATAIVPGIGECELVRLKGKPPTDVLVGESGKGQREVQVLYAEPGGRELYFFVDNRLERIVR